ncbi:MAG: hypothetical protein KGS46_19695 [Chloroflexi bacterium]|nr:hypothetical protein [Chloroflexota bacterium]
MNRQLAFMIAGGLTVAISGISGLMLTRANINVDQTNKQVAKPTVAAIANATIERPSNAVAPTIQPIQPAATPTAMLAIVQNPAEIALLNSQIQAANRILDEREALYQAKLKEAYAVIQQRETAYQEKLQVAYEKLQVANTQSLKAQPVEAALPIVRIEQAPAMQPPAQVAQPVFIQPATSQPTAQIAQPAPIAPVAQVVQPAPRPEPKINPVKESEHKDEKKSEHKESEKKVKKP